jgi:hypothetical protein
MSDRLSYEHMLMLQQLKLLLFDGTLDSLLALRNSLQGKSLESSHLDSFEHWYRELGPGCFRLPFLVKFFKEDYGKQVSEIINRLYIEWSKDYE